MNNRKTGDTYEKKAILYLKDKDIKVVVNNFRCKIGEIDIIGYDDDTLVFFEVKYRKTHDKGFAGEAVNFQKQKKISRVSDYYRMINSINDFSPCRFDVITIDGDEITWIKNAFYYIPRN